MTNQPTSEKIIDWALSLKRANNKPDLAKELLELLVEDLQQTQNKILQAGKTKDLKELLHYTHKLHGATCYCGVPRLENAAAMLESQLKIKNNPDLEKFSDALNTEIAAVLTTYQTEFTEKNHE
jgi:two-component system sensor histidine kinase BarA